MVFPWFPRAARSQGWRVTHIYPFIALMAFSSIDSVYTFIAVAGVGGITSRSRDILTLATFCLCSSLFTFLLYKRRLTQQQAWSLVRKDADSYDGVWHETAQSHEGVLGDIAMVVRATRDEQLNDQSLALNERAAHVQHLRHVLQGPSGRPDANGSLQQFLWHLPFLYAQAFVLDTHFQKKRAAWAAGLAEHIHANVKRPTRAIEKLWRTYHGNARLLTDLVRGSIVCNTPSDILVVLQRIRADPAVEILRVKNRLTTTYSSSQSGGHRNLSLNLIVVDEITCEACTDSHICELQLQLRAMYGLKTDGGHRRFVSYRDRRAE